jgi:hypothetical protein
MVITILAEPRSGSTNLANWFTLYKNFTVSSEPLNENSWDYKKGQPIKEWTCDTEHFLIKEIYLPGVSLTELIGISDKIILLYRENGIEQLESWLVAVETKNWLLEWAKHHVKITDQQNKENYFKSLKDGFKNEYLNDTNYFSISYEELYYRNGFQKVLDYLNLPDLENKNFPYGQKYRINLVPNKLL